MIDLSSLAQAMTWQFVLIVIRKPLAVLVVQCSFQRGIKKSS